MSIRFKNRYRIESIRLKHWNYGWEGSYFITICTQKKEHFFGDVRNGVMFLNESGRIADQLWQEIPCHFSFINLNNFVVMPDHFHGILTIHNNMIIQKPSSILQQQSSEKIGGGITGYMNPMGQNNISRVIRWYKGRCSYDIHKINPGFQWQSRYYDHIIRSAAEFDRIIDYIADNPAKWIH